MKNKEWDLIRYTYLYMLTNSVITIIRVSYTSMQHSGGLSIEEVWDAVGIKKTSDWVLPAERLRTAPIPGGQ